MKHKYFSLVQATWTLITSKFINSDLRTKTKDIANDIDDTQEKEHDHDQYSMYYVAANPK
jgi:hypothetical protein